MAETPAQRSIASKAKTSASGILNSLGEPSAKDHRGYSLRLKEAVVGRQAFGWRIPARAGQHHYATDFRGSRGGVHRVRAFPSAWHQKPQASHQDARTSMWQKIEGSGRSEHNSTMPLLVRATSRLGIAGVGCDASAFACQSKKARILASFG